MNDSDDGGPRSAPRGWLRRHPFLVGTVVLFLLVILGIVFADFAASRRLSLQLHAIRRGGDPTTVQELIAAERPMPANENLTLLLLESVRPFHSVDAKDKRFRAVPFVTRTLRMPTGQRLTAEHLEAGSAFLALDPGALRQLHDACRQPKGQLIYGWTRPILLMDRAETSYLRLASDVLALEVLISAEKNEVASTVSALKDCYACTGMLDANSHYTLISNLARNSILARALDVSERVTNLLQLNDSQVHGIQDDITVSIRKGGLLNALVVERIAFLDAIEFTGSGSWWKRVSSRLPVIGYLDTQEGLGIITRLIEALRTPEPGTWDAVRNRPQIQSIPDYYKYTGSLLASYDRAAGLEFRTIGQARALLAALACERHRLAHGKWPATLAELVPAYLDAVPEDPFDNKPIRYAPIAKGIKLWTVGPDGVDDGGDVQRGEESQVREPKDAGWVILNSDQRGRQ